MSRAAIINVVGLTARHLSEENTPQIMAWLKHEQIAPVQPVTQPHLRDQATYNEFRLCILASDLRHVPRPPFRRKAVAASRWRGLRLFYCARCHERV